MAMSRRRTGQRNPPYKTAGLIVRVAAAVSGTSARISFLMKNYISAMFTTRTPRSPSLHIGSVDVQQSSPWSSAGNGRGAVCQFPVRLTCMCILVNSNYGQAIITRGRRHT
jgi:hypothetical protein